MSEVLMALLLSHSRCSVFDDAGSGLLFFDTRTAGMSYPGQRCRCISSACFLLSLGGGWLPCTTGSTTHA